MRQTLPRILPYVGSKWRLARTIVGLMPPHEVYIEVFGGSAAVLFHKPRSRMEVYNDINGDVVNFFRVLRDSPEELARAVALTPWARAEYYEAQAALGKVDSPVERARRLLVVHWMSHNPSAVVWRTGFRADRPDRLRRWVKLPGSLLTVASRLRGVIIEQMDFESIIEKYDSQSTFFYCDPPYLCSTRHENTKYASDMPDDDHARLADALASIRGTAIVSGYPTEEYRRLYEERGWGVVDVRVTNMMMNEKTERLWLHPRIRRAVQMSLPGLDGGNDGEEKTA